MPNAVLRGLVRQYTAVRAIAPERIFDFYNPRLVMLNYTIYTCCLAGFNQR